VSVDLETLRLRRILLALDATAAGGEALEEAVALAERTHAELLGLFVEDPNLIHLAHLPFARTFSTTGERGVDALAMERGLRVQGERLRELLAHQAQLARIPWSFRMARGPVLPTLMAAAAEADLLILGRPGCGVGVLATPRVRAAPPGPVLVVLEDRPEGARALATAAELALRRGSRLDVVVAEGVTLDPALADRLRAHRVPFQVVPLPATDAEGLLNSVIDRHGRILVLSDGQRNDQGTLAVLLSRVGCPLVVVR
jgi:nucleotide-binding universal stress UspA family protein